MLNPTQSQQQAPTQGAPVAPTQGQPSAAPANPAQPQGQPQQQDQSQSANGVYDQNIGPGLEQHLNSLPKEQQAFIGHYLTPETTTLLGIVGGVEVYDYFKKYTDPSKMAVIVPRNSVPGGGQAMEDDQQAENSGDESDNTEQTPVDKEVEDVQDQQSKTPGE